MEFLKGLGVVILGIVGAVLYFCFYAVMFCLMLYVGFRILSWIF